MRYQIISGNSVGKVHREHNQSSQDAVYGTQSGRYCCIALADGAGSRCCSGDGAMLAVRYTCRYLMKHRNEIFSEDNQTRFRYLFTKGLYRHLERYAEKRGYPLFTYGSTLLFVITDGIHYFSGHIGDGAILCERMNGYNVVSYPDGCNNSTYLTTGFFSYKHLRAHIGKCESIRSFILVSDGVIPNTFSDYYQLRRSGTILEAVSESVAMPHDDDASFILCKWSEQNG